MTTTHSIRTLVVAMLAALAVIVPVSLFAAVDANADYRGSRWEHADRAICVTMKNIKTTAVKDAVKRSVAYWNSETVLEVRVRNDCYDLGYTQRIVVYDGYYSRGASGWVEWKGGFKWYQSKTAAPWTVGDGWTYAHQSPVIVKINRNYTDGSSKWRQHVVSHELGHALGLDHSHTVKSVMTESTKDYFKYGGYWDFKGTVEHPGINKIYANG